MPMSVKEKVEKILENTPAGQTKFQIRHFVIGDQAHRMHQVRQAVIEIEVREISLHKMNYQAEKRKLELQLKKENLEKERGSLSETEIKLHELEIKREQWKVVNQDKTIKGLKKEMQYLYDILEELTCDLDIDKMLDKFDELDENYWVRRLARQASVDMATSGRISPGNLAAIGLLPEELQNQALKETIRLSNQSVNQIQKQIMVGQNSEHEYSKLDYDLKE